MSDVAIQFVLDNLKQIAVYHANLIINVKDEVEGLIRDLAVVKAFIEDLTEKIGEHRVVRELVKSIRDLTFEAEDAIDAFMVEATDHKSRKWIQKVFGTFDHTYKLRQVAKKFETIRAKVKEIYDDNPIFGYEAGQGGDPFGRRRMERKIPDVEKDNVVGFDTAATTLIDLLIGKTEDLQVISIIGMGGLGKTTLANKVYNDPRVVHEFSIRSWICLSQTYRKKELFLSILKSVTQVTSEMSNMGDDELADEVRRNLTWKYLIVVDDVWEKNDWDNIRKAFPDIKNGSRILLTSRNEPVAVYASLHSPACKLEPYKLDFLTDQQSWELLQIKVFGGEVPEENHDLMDAGMRIALECNGLPLAVVVIAGVLQTNKRKDWWETVANRVDAFLEVCINVLALSYHHLSPYLKACFLYFGVFREDYEIPVWILIRLWIAEGFVQKIGNECLEEMAEKHLEDLVARNLVLVVQRSFSGRIKTCRIHDMLRDLCLKKALVESFLSEMKVDGKSPITPHVSIINRRLCIHSGVEKYISSKPSGLRVRSFLCFAKDQVNLPRSHVAYIPKVFKWLRVYHIQPIRSPRFPSEIEKLVYLKYVAFSGEFKTIPASMSKLWNLETLIVETSSRTIDIQANIWNMLQLRHLHTNAASELHCPVDKKDKDRDNAIQTLSTITPESCTKGVLGKTPSIKKLGIRGKLATLLENGGFLENGGSLFDNLTNLQQLVTLKLLNDTFPLPPFEMKLQGLPSRKLPPNLKRLTLADTFLEWKHMSVLEMLLELEELKLKDNAFVGVRWSLLDGGFKKLKALQIYKTDLVYWEAKADHFPSLQHIVLKDCTRLSTIPSSLGTSKTLRTIKLHQTSQAAAASAWDIKQHLGNGLKLDIFPLDLGQGLPPVRVQDLRDEIEDSRKQLLQLELEHRVEIMRKQLLQLELEQRDEVEDLRKQLLQLELEQKLKQKQHFETEDSTSNQGSDWESKTIQAETKKDAQELVKDYTPYEISYALKSYTDSLGFTIQETPKVSHVGKVAVQLINVSSFFELDSMKNVEVLIVDCIMGTRKKRPIQLLFEHDILSTYFPGREVPDRFVSKNVGSTISFTVTLSPYGYSRGLDLCLVYTLPADIDFLQSPLQVEISITSSGIKRSYTPRCYGIPETGGDMVWLMHWVEEDLFKEGDVVQVSFNIGCNGQIKECGVCLLPCDKGAMLQCRETLRKSLKSNAFQVLPLPGFPTPDEQNLSAPDLKSREEEDSERLQIQVRQYSDSTISISEDVGTSGTAPEGGVLSMEEFVVTEGQDLFPEDEESLTKLTDALSDVRVLSYTSTSMYTLPQYIFRLVALQKLFLRSCELLMMELPPEIGELKNLEVLDLEGTEILCLPMEIAKLVNLTCLKVSFYGYANQTVIPRGVLSNLLRLKELIIDVTPYGEWWDVEEVKAIIDDLHSLKELRTLKLYLPTAELLKYLTSISPGLANFRFAVGRHKEHFISRLPRDVEEEFNNWEKLEKGLKFINGDCIPNEITKVFKRADAFFLQRHWTAKSLSEFGHENMNEVKFCLVMECNEFQTVIDSEQYYQGKDSRSGSENFLDFHETIVLGSLESLIIRYMKNMESIWKGPVRKGSLFNMKSLALHTCPILTTLFTVDMLINLTNLEELIVEDCPKIESLVSLKSTGSNSGLFLRSLKKISLLELPELVSISSGLWIAPNLERMVIFYCPKLEKLSTTEVSSTELKVIKAEKEWWDALKWYESDLSTEHEDYLARLFIPLRRDGDLMAQLTED